jgi:prostaglandin-endoperoxide synthase 2
MTLKDLYSKIFLYSLFFFLENFGFIWKLRIVPVIKGFIMRQLYFISSKVNFPTPLSTISPYTTLETFTEEQYYNRALTESDNKYPPYTVDELAKMLFQRGSTPKKLPYETPKNSILLLSFAQLVIDQALLTNDDNPKTQIAKKFFDLSSLYGDTIEITKTYIRSGIDGKLKSQIINGEEYPLFVRDNPIPITNRLKAQIPPNIDTNKLFAIGHLRLNVFHGSSLIIIVLLREHNRLCDILKKTNPCWDDERLFQTARNILVVQFVKITTNEYTGKHLADSIQFKLELMPKATNYRNWPFGVVRQMVEFNYAYRWHSLVPDSIKIKGVTHSFADVSWHPEFIYNNGLSQVTTDFSNQSATQFGLLNTPSFLISEEARTITENRINKMASYNDYRERYGMWRVHSFEEITSDVETQNILKKVYKHVDNIEFYPGLMAEQPFNTKQRLPLLMGLAINSEAIKALAGHPLVSPDVYNAKTFTQVGLEIIDDTTLETLFNRNMKGNPRVSFVPL